jgi:hypothetical protein
MYIFYKRANRDYVPAWMYWAGAWISIFDGIVNLFVVPFGYHMNATTSWVGYMLRHTMNTYEKESDARMDRANGEG